MLPICGVVTLCKSSPRGTSPVSLQLQAFWECGAFVYGHSKVNATEKPSAQLQDYIQFAGFMLCRLGFSNCIYWKQLSSWKAEQFLSLHIVVEVNQLPWLTFSLSVLTLGVATNVAVVAASHVCTQRRSTAETWFVPTSTASLCLARMWKQDRGSVEWTRQTAFQGMA